MALRRFRIRRKKIQGVSPKVQRILYAVPKRMPVKWERDGKEIIITFKKDFTRFERWLQKKIGGPEDIRLRLDEKGARVWELCDGKHTLKEICDMLHEEFKEDIEPVFPRTSKFIEMLLQRNLITLEAKYEEENADMPSVRGQ